MCLSDLTCVEDHEVVGGTSLQNASVHVDVVAHSHRAVPEGAQGHAADGGPVPGQSHCGQITAGSVPRLPDHRPLPATSLEVLTDVKAVDSRQTLTGTGAGRPPEEEELPSHNASRVCQKKKKNV